MQIRKPDIHISAFLIIIGVLIFATGCSDDKPTSSIQYGWAPLEAGIDNAVISLAIYDNKLIAEGYFSTAEGVIVQNIAAWNGSTWSSLGTGMDNTVRAFTVYNNKLIAAGSFTTAGDVSANRIAAWGSEIAFRPTSAC